MSELFVVGIGPGSKEHMTYLAYESMEKADVIIGYTAYTELVKDMFKGKEIISTGMGSEEERCRIALKHAEEKCVALICSGDAVIYGMAGLIYELKNEYQNVEIKVVPGVSAAISGSALIGAGVGNDFAVISLSNYLTDKESTYNRLKMCAKSDMVMVLYNPSSKARPDCLKDACEFLMNYIEPERVCAIAKNIGRENESYSVITLRELSETDTDMFTTVFIGSSMTKNIDGKFVTSRGYKL